MAYAAVKVKLETMSEKKKEQERRDNVTMVAIYYLKLLVPCAS